MRQRVALRKTLAMAAMCSGVGPQHPPIISAPAARIAGTNSAIIAGVSGKMSTPLRLTGMPALACTRMGAFGAAARISLTTSII